jgi:hypothetical protein
MYTSAEQRTYPRRAILTAGAGLVVAGTGGCDLVHRTPEPPLVPDPLEPFLAQTKELAGRYDATIAAQPALAARLTPLRDAHHTHAAELAKIIRLGPSQPPSSAGPPTPPADPAAALAALRTAEQSAAKDATAACLAAPATRAELLGSIAACRTTHAAVLA